MDADVTDPAVLRLASPVLPSDGPRLCAELTRLAATGATEIVCDVSALHTAQLAAVDALSRLRLTAHRTGCHLRLHHPTPQLRALLELTGLAEPLGLGEAP
ncbi:STAS domain-containing protein [Streptomyces koyangensis]|uniref:STAS domain-containing protein n=1 Tax=Streptomyces koyangensis TaxID=188770 RepID=UPI003C2E6289